MPVVRPAEAGRMKAWKWRRAQCTEAANRECYRELMSDAELAFSRGDFETAEALIARAEGLQADGEQAAPEAP